LAVVRIQIADHEPAAVKENQHRECFALRGTVDANGDRPRRTGNTTILHFGDGLFRAARFDHLCSNRSCFRQGKLLNRRRTGRREHVEKRFRLRM